MFLSINRNGLVSLLPGEDSMSASLRRHPHCNCSPSQQGFDAFNGMVNNDDLRSTPHDCNLIGHKPMVDVVMVTVGESLVVEVIRLRKMLPRPRLVGRLARQP